jgi:hypothetical protein
VREIWKSEDVKFPVPMSEWDQTRDKDLLWHTEWKMHERSTGALCYHAHGMFMRKLFEYNPGGGLYTGKAVYDCEEGFDRVHPTVGAMNVGSRAHPEPFNGACYCVDYGITSF